MLNLLGITVGALDGLNLLGWLSYTVSAWRYLLSRAYRARVHARWQHATQLQTTAEIIGALICLAGTLFLVGVLICAKEASTKVKCVFAHY